MKTISACCRGCSAKVEILCPEGSDPDSYENQCRLRCYAEDAGLAKDEDGWICLGCHKEETLLAFTYAGITLNEKSILLDMDGVLVDFVGGTCDLFGWDIEKIDGSWDYYKAFGMASSDFYGEIAKAGASFWVNLKPYPWAESLWKRCNEVCPTYFFSTPTLDSGSIGGKYQWLVNWTGDKKFDKFAFTYHKHLAARPGNLLIDDREENVDKFIQSSGEAILFPTKWNRRRDEMCHAASLTLEEVYKWARS